MSLSTKKSTFLIQSTTKQSIGTGFVVYADEQGVYLVTCMHVIDECEKDVLEINGKKAELIKQGSADEIDLALLYVKGLENTKALNLCADTVKEGTLLEIEGFKVHKKSNVKLEKLDGRLNKVSQIYANHKKIDTYELSIEKEDSIEKGYSGAAVVLKGTTTVIAVATDRERNGKDAYAVPIAYLKEIWGEMPEFVNCKDEISNINKNNEEEGNFMEKKYLLPIIVAIIGGLFMLGTEMMKSSSEPVKTAIVKENNITQSHISTS